jgi:hypothetical protein
MRIAFLLLVFASTAAAAPLDPEFKAPLTWRVVVQAQDHPLLPAEFRQQFCKDLRMALATGFEKNFCRVEVIDLAGRKPETWEPLWKSFHKLGWPALESDSARPLDGQKTHFVKLSIRDGNTFRIEARQLDGFTGLLSTSITSKETSSPELVSRLAGRMIAPEYGPVGTIVPIPADPKHVRIRLRGGQLPGIDRLVQTNDVFAFSNITAKDNGALLGQQKPFTYLRVVGPVVEGEVRCEILSRYKQPLEERRGIIGNRCMKIATQTGPIRLKIVDKDGLPAPANAPFELWTADTGFLPAPASRNDFDYHDNTFASIRPMQRLACVVVKLGASRIEAFVLPVGHPNDPPIVLRINIKAEDIAQAEFEQSCEAVRKNVAEAALKQVELFRRLGQLIGEGKNETALAEATSGLQSADATEKTLWGEIAELRKDPLAANEALARLLTSCENQLKLLRAGRARLEKSIDELKDAVAKANDPVKFEREFRAKELARQIEYHVGRGEVPTALGIYDQLIELTKQDDLPAKKAKLEAEWKPKDDAHTAARKVLFDEWRKAATLDEFKAAVPKLKPMIDDFTKHSDKLGLRNFLNSLPTASARLLELAAALDESIPADREALKAIKQLDDDIRKADEAATAAVK